MQAHMLNKTRYVLLKVTDSVKQYVKYWQGEVQL